MTSIQVGTQIVNMQQENSRFRVNIIRRQLYSPIQYVIVLCTLYSTLLAVLSNTVHYSLQCIVLCTRYYQLYYSFQQIISYSLFYTVQPNSSVYYAVHYQLYSHIYTTHVTSCSIMHTVQYNIIGTFLYSTLLVIVSCIHCQLCSTIQYIIRYSLLCTVQYIVSCALHSVHYQSQSSVHCTVHCQLYSLNSTLLDILICTVH